MAQCQVKPLKQHEMLWSLFQPPERNRSHYLFLLACISTSSHLSIHTDSRPSILSLKKTGHRRSIISVYSCTSCLSPPMSTRPLCVLCIYPISSCAKPSKGNMYMSKPVLLARNHRRQRITHMCLLHYSALFLKHSTEGTHTHKFHDEGGFLFNLPNVRPVFPIFLCDLLHFHSPKQ